MKLDTLKILYEPEDIHAHMRQLWRTEDFRKSHAEGGFIWEVVERYARLPRFFFEASDSHLETPHFSSWWGGMQIRSYDSDAVHDLYYLHEMWHSARMIYIPGMTFRNFERKLVDNELGASVCSEIAIYFHLPELRKKSFPYEIYADRFLKDPGIMARWQDDPDETIRELGIHRRNVMLADIQSDHPDRVEFWIHKFARQNEAWTAIWADRYDLVESAMVRLRDECRTLGRHEAMDRFMGWLLSDGISYGKGIPFPAEAEAFAGVYRKNKLFYAEQHALEQEGRYAAKVPKPEVA